MTLWKRLLSVALCLCLVYTAVPVSVLAAKADPNAKPTITSYHKTQYFKGGYNYDISSITYYIGAVQGPYTAVCGASDIDNGKNFTVTTESNKNAEFCFFPFTTSLVVPAKTTCTVKQNFTMQTAEQMVSNKRATAAASFELFYFGETPAAKLTQMIPATKDTTDTSFYGVKADGQSLLRGYRTGSSSGATRNIDKGAVLSNTLDCVYKNDTDAEQTITLNFGFWACTQYASTYANRLNMSFDVTLGDMTAVEQVAFDPNGGSVGTTTKTVTYGSTYGTLPTPTRTNYTFDGWYTAKTGGTRVSTSTKVTTFGAHTLYAHWTGKKSTVTFDANGGSVSPTSQTATYGDAYGTLPTPTRTGYDFTGWYTAKTGGTKGDDTTTVTKTANHTLYARWTAKKFTVTFDACDGEVDPTSKIVVYGSTYGELPVPTQEGSGFGGWYTKTEGRGEEITRDSIVDLTDDQTLYALWISQPKIDWYRDQTIEYGDRSKAFFGISLNRECYDYLFEWYQCDADGKNGKLVGTSRITSTIDEPSYHTPSDLPVGTYYFYATITRTDLDYGKSASVTGSVQKLTVEPSTPEVATWPDAITVNLNSGSNRLGDYAILNAAMQNQYSKVPVSGTFAWVDPDRIFKPTSTWDTTRCEILFTPDDTTSYKPTTFSFDITVRHAHDYVDAEEITAATCTEAGTMKQECSICGTTRNVTIPALGHDYEGGVWVTNDTRHWKQCSRCDSTDTPADHVFGEWSGGKRTCEICGYQERQIITVTITWSEMAFTYTDGGWDPTTHTYTAGEWTADSRDGNRITVENAGDSEVSVSFVYTQVNDSVAGSVADEENTVIDSPVALPAGDKKVAWLHLSGKPTQDMHAETVGKVTVRLGGDT